MMKPLIRSMTVIFPALLLLGVSAPTPTPPTRYLVKIDVSEFRSNLSMIRDNDFDVAGINIPKQKVDLILNQSQFDTLQSAGVRISENIKTISQLAPDAKYKNPDKVAQILKGYAQSYPDLAQILTVGKSLEGRDILVLRMTQHVSQNISNKPAILFNGMHHAREVMATEVPLDMIDYLLTHYGKDAKVTHWMNGNQIYVMPMFNVDGNNLVWTQDTMWRKNARGGYGVDINRNYPYKWNSCNGSSDSTGAQDYHGASAASEPETNVMMNFVKNIHPVFDISFHSYSELVIYPYGCGEHTETKDVVEPIGMKLAELVSADEGSGHYTGGLAPDLLYSVDGSDIDWMYHEAHVIPYVIELNSDSQGFQPAYDEWRDKTVTKLRPAWQYLLDRMDGSSIRGNVQLPSGVVASVHAEDVTGGFSQTYPVRADGTFHMILNPGDYKLTFQAVGMQNLEQTVHVDQSRVNLNVALKRN